MPLETVWQLDFVVARPSPHGALHAFAGWTFVSPGYFDVFSIPIVRGRDFTERDDAGASGVVIMNQEMARRFWPNADPLNDSLIIGRSVRPDYDADPIRQIVGIVGDVRDARPQSDSTSRHVRAGRPGARRRDDPQRSPSSDRLGLHTRRANRMQSAPLIERDLQEVSRGLPVARIDRWTTWCRSHRQNEI